MRVPKIKSLVWRRSPRLNFIQTCGIITLMTLFFTFGISCSDSESSSGVIDHGTPTVDWIADGTISTGEYTRSSTYGNWEVNWRIDDQYINIGLRAETSGWVAIGIQPGSRMKDADIIFGFVEEGQTTVHDLFSTGDFGPHPPDTELEGTDDILEFAGNEQDGHTTIEFKRALDTGDTYDNPLSRGVNKIIWAYGSSDNSSMKHSSKGYGELEF